jgi:CubicO group peptidase (beta-lactamase class C family)
MRTSIFAVVACLWALHAPPAAADRWPGETWEESTPAQEGLDEQKIRELDSQFRSGKHGYVDSMMIVRNGRIVFEAAYPRDYRTINVGRMTEESGPWNYYDATWHPYYQGSDLHTMQSTTKSVMSALVGIAIARGDLPGVNSTLGELLPHRKLTDTAKASITLENILTMRPGFEWLEEQVSYWDPRNDATRVELTKDWVGYLLEKPLAVPQGEVFNYNSTNTQLLSEIVSTATGKPLDEYAKEVLFNPIGIQSWFWKSAPEGYRDAAGGLYLAPRDLARLALLYLRDGKWNGRQVIPAAWVERSTQPLVKDVSPEDPTNNVGYGYQWWVFNDGSDGRPAMFGTWGWGGQFGLVVPSLDLVGVFTGWNVYDETDFEYAFKLFYDRVVVPSASASAARRIN